VNPEKYGFIPIGDNGRVLFSVYKVTSSDEWRVFVKQHFEDFAISYYKAMEWDSVGVSGRKRKLITFLKSIFDQEDDLVPLLMIKGISALVAEGIEEEELVTEMITKILPNGGFCKKLKDQKYIWNISEDRKLKKSIGRAFVMHYISNKFDKDIAWKWLKKNCYQNVSGEWMYKNKMSKDKILGTIKTFLSNGGIPLNIVNNDENNFDAFFSLQELNKTASGSKRFILEKEEGGKKRFYVHGIAATTGVDRDDERMSSKFIAKMRKVAVGLPLFVETHRPSELRQTIGKIVKSGGDENNFIIEAILENEENNPKVKELLQKMDSLDFDGHSMWGFSVGGKVSKAYKEHDAKLDKDVIVLDDGDLFHVLLTNQPANAGTMAEAIAKSLDKDLLRPNTPTAPKSTAMKHSSSLQRNPVDISEFNKSTQEAPLPDVAYPIDYRDNKVYKDYAHHYVAEGELYLHKQQLLAQYQKALQNKAPAVVIGHLRTHMATIGLTSVVEKMSELIDTMNTIDSAVAEVSSIAKALDDAIKSEVKGLVRAVRAVNKAPVSKDSKAKLIKSVLDSASIRISTCIEQLSKKE
jgi:hypothetical protein